MPYHLAIYHLDCIRRQLDHNVQVAFIPKLSCSGDSQFNDNGTAYTWSNEIYFQSGTFLQKQELKCVIMENSSCKSLNFHLCPHMRFKMTGLWFQRNRAFLVAKAFFRHSRVYYEDNGHSTRWSSETGQLARMDGCKKCYAESEAIIELRGEELHIRYTCYKDLGNATDRSQPKWRALLTGQGKTSRYWLGTVASQVWRTANQLKRPNLHLITYQTRYGERDSKKDSWIAALKFYSSSYEKPCAIQDEL
ncbi:hypothetical protein F5Y16DRAFT_386510 [Xylariaceae sp. FL0255]|nr:hypothetical protein F5Y16DRAFT_386510 [Xylariaceae sp. FL0255]